MIIRKPLPTEVEAIAEIERSTLSPWNYSAILSELTEENRLLLVAIDTSGVVVGWCCVMVVDFEAEVLKIAVAPERRHQGIATGLIDKVEAECGMVETFYLEVRAENTGARSFYQKRGYKNVSLRKKYYRNPTDDAVIYMKKRIGKEE